MDCRRANRAGGLPAAHHPLTREEYCGRRRHSRPVPIFPLFQAPRRLLPSRIPQAAGNPVSLHTAVGDAPEPFGCKHAPRRSDRVVGGAESSNGQSSKGTANVPSTGYPRLCYLGHTGAHSCSGKAYGRWLLRLFDGMPNPHADHAKPASGLGVGILRDFVGAYAAAALHSHIARGGQQQGEIVAAASRLLAA